MNYNNDFLFGIQLAYFVLGILTATFIGSVSCGIWLLLSKGAAKFYVKDAMKYMRLVLACFIVPMLPFAMYPLINRWGIMPGPHMIKSMTDVLKVVLCIWLVSVVFMTLRRLYNYILICKLCQDSIPIEDEKILEQIKAWKEELRIRRRIKVSLNSNVSSPAILYHLGYQILLPAYEMTEQEINMAVLHELVHLKHRDVFIKDLCFAVNVIHGFNPISRYIKEHVVKWAEVLCDLTTCEVGKNTFTRQEYYYGIIDLMKNAEVEMRNEAIFSLSESKSLLEFRVDKFAEANKPKQKSLRIVLYFVFVFMVVVTSFTLYVTASATNAWYEASLVGKEQEEKMLAPKELESTTYAQMFTDNEDMYVENYNFEESLDAKKQLLAGETWYIYIDKKGVKKITAHVFTESTDYMLGCVDEKGNVSYINGDGTGVQCFEGQEHPKALFIKNNGETSIELDIAVVAE